MKRTIFIFLSIIYSYFSFGQKIPNGVYVGYEQNPFCYVDNCVIIHDTLTKEVKSKLYYKVTVNVTDSLITLEKIPIYFFDCKDSIPLSDSTMGGYYYYMVDLIKNNTSDTKMADRILGRLTDCRYCKPCGSATCRYIHVSYQYRKQGENLIFSSDREFNILFEKQ